MAKRVDQSVLDAALNEIGGAELLTVCEGEPASYAEATTAKPGGKMLASIAVSAGDFALANGDIDGRKIVVSQKTALAIVADGTGDHVALTTSNGLRVLAVTTAPALAITQADTLDVTSWQDEIADPA